MKGGADYSRVGRASRIQARCTGRALPTPHALPHVSSFAAVSQTEHDDWAYTKVLIREYNDLSGDEALITPWETTSSDPNDT